MTTNSALSASLRSLRLRRLLAGAGVLAFAAVAFTGSRAWGEPPKPREKIVFTNSTPNPDPVERAKTAELYIMDPDGSNPTRLTNDGLGDALATLSPDGKGKIVFDSNRIAIDGGGTPFDSDLFLLNPAAAAAGVQTPPRPLTRGSSASIDPSGNNIVFHRSASGTYGTRIGVCQPLPMPSCRAEPGGPTTDSDIFVFNLDDEGEPVNLTNGLTSTPGVRGQFASDDADWSPDGRWIAFTSRKCVDYPNCATTSDAGIYVMNLETPDRVVTKLTNLDNLGTEERSPAWSPDSTRIAIMRRPPPNGPFDVWVLGFDPETVTVTTQTPLTRGLAPHWSPPRPTGKEEILFGRPTTPGVILVMNADGSNEHALTGPPGLNGFANWGLIAVGRDPQ